jgi:hypothetical protein
MNVNPKSLLAASVCALAVQCTPHQQQGAVIGALGGAAVGALAGDDSRDVARGAAIGAAVGTGVAAMTEPGHPGTTPPPRYGAGGTPAPGPATGTAPPPAPDDYPVARRTAKPNEVISPFPPYNVIDVTGFQSGQLARDPSNQEIFRVP